MENFKIVYMEIRTKHVEPEAPAEINLLVHCSTNMFEEIKICVILYIIIWVCD